MVNPWHPNETKLFYHAILTNNLRIKTSMAINDVLYFVVKIYFANLIKFFIIEVDF